LDSGVTLTLENTQKHPQVSSPNRSTNKALNQPPLLPRYTSVEASSGIPAGSYRVIFRTWLGFPILYGLACAAAYFLQKRIPDGLSLGVMVTCVDYLIGIIFSSAPEGQPREIDSRCLTDLMSGVSVVYEKSLKEADLSALKKRPKPLFQTLLGGLLFTSLLVVGPCVTGWDTKVKADCSALLCTIDIKSSSEWRTWSRSPEPTPEPEA